jgi:hypothetical protein
MPGLFWLEQVGCFQPVLFFGLSASHKALMRSSMGTPLTLVALPILSLVCRFVDVGRSGLPIRRIFFNAANDPFRSYPQIGADNYRIF